MISTQEKVDSARGLFLDGYNCAQAVFAAFAREAGLEREAALKLASGMGGGIGGLRMTCGAVSAMAMALGAAQGYDEAGDVAGKKRLYARIQAMHARFLDEYETSRCAELLKAAGVAAGQAPAERTPEYYRTRPCVRYVEKCAEILAEELRNEGL